MSVKVEKFKSQTQNYFFDNYKKFTQSCQPIKDFNLDVTIINL